MSVPSMVGSHVYYAATRVWDWDQLENVCVDKRDVGYCACRLNLGILSRFRTCYMMIQAEIQSQQRMYRSKLVILEILHNECTINGGKPRILCRNPCFGLGSVGECTR